MTFDVGATPHSQWQALIPLLESLGWERSRAADPETWYRADPAVAAPATKYLLLHTRPEVAIAHAMEDGESPAGAVEEWRAAAECLVAFYKRNRANTVVIEVTSALQEPLVCSEAICEQLGLEAPGNLPKLAPFPKPEPLNQLLANQLISQSNELSHLLAELEACTLPLTDEVITSPSVEVQALYKQLQSDARDKLDEELTTLKAEQLKLERELEEAKEEAGLTLNQLTTIQKQLDAQREQNSRLKADALQQQQEREHEQEELKKSLEEARKEGELTLHQLFAVQEELEQYYHQNKTLQSKDETASAVQKQHDAYEKDNAHHKKELAQLTQERDRLQQQIISLTSDKSSGAKSLEEIREEAELNLEQLAYSQKQLSETQKQLAKHVNDCAQYKREVDQLTQERDQLQQQLVALTTDQNKLQKSLEEAREEGDLTLHQLFKVQEELEKYYLDNKALNKLMKEKDSKLTWLRGLKKDLEQSVGKSKLEAQNLKKSLKQKEAEAQGLSSTLQSVHASASWKLTAPLRVITRPFSREKKYRKKLAALIESSPYFDAKWYLKTYDDVAKSGGKAAEHYIMHGAQEGRDPGPLFDTRRYLETYTDVAKEDVNPLVHFIQFGEAEGRSPKP